MSQALDGAAACYLADGVLCVSASSSAPTLVDVPADALREHIFARLDRFTLLMSRQVCRRLAALVPARRLNELGLLSLAASAGHIWFLRRSLVRIAFQQPTGVIAAAICTAALKGQSRVIEWFHEQNLIPLGRLSRRLGNAAAAGGHVPLMKYLLSESLLDSEGTQLCCEAAGGGHLALLAWLHVRRFPWSAETCSLAARNGHLNVLTWARTAGCPWDHTTIVSAADNGHLDVLEWATLNGCPLPAGGPGSLVVAAAGGGHVHVLRWLRWRHTNLELPLGASVAAAGAGHLSALQWLRNHGALWTEAVLLTAARSKRLQVLEWALQSGCPCESSSVALEVTALGDAALLQLLRSCRCTLDECEES